ncbi:MAG: choice-of-anchor D domain-containing protein, partial [Gemmatimonadota bacterium]
MTALGLAAAACEAGERASALDGRPDSLVFEALAVGRMSPARIVEWTNSGADTTVFSDLYVSGPAATDFVVAEDLCGGATLFPGQSCSAAVLFGPRAVGPREATIAVGPASEGPATVVLLGEGIANSTAMLEPVGFVRAVPETLDFGEQPLGAPGGPLGVRLVNQRPGPVQFAVRLRGGQATGFRIALDRCSNEILRPGRACTVQVLFEPAAEGLLSGELILRDLNGPTDQAVPLSGTGVPAAPATGEARASVPVASLSVSVSPQAVEFGVLEPGSTSPVRQVVIKNEGATNVAFRSLQVAGSDAGAFRIVQNDCGGGLVPT